MDDEYINVTHRVTGQHRDRDDQPPADLQEAARRYDFTRQFIEDALVDLVAMDPAELDAFTRSAVARWYRQSDGYREYLADMVNDQ